MWSASACLVEWCPARAHVCAMNVVHSETQLRKRLSFHARNQSGQGSSATRPRFKLNDSATLAPRFQPISSLLAVSRVTVANAGQRRRSVAPPPCPAVAPPPCPATAQPSWRHQGAGWRRLWRFPLAKKKKGGNCHKRASAKLELARTILPRPILSGFYESPLKIIGVRDNRTVHSTSSESSPDGNAGLAVAPERGAGLSCCCTPRASSDSSDSLAGRSS